MVEEVQCGQAPVDATESQVFREPVLQFMSPLLRSQCQLGAEVQMECRYVRCRDSECIGHAVPRTASTLRAADRTVHHLGQDPLPVT